MSRKSAKKHATRKDAVKEQAPKPEAGRKDAVHEEAPKPDAGRKETHFTRKDSSGHERLKLPNWPLLGLAAAGMGVAGYLTYTGWSGARALYCEVGGGCDVVQSSRWATLLGVPMAFWGFLTYAVLAAIAWRVRRATTHWQLAWLVAGVGWGVSVYLTAISVFVLQATCLYCLTSLAIFTAAVAVLVWQKPEGIAGFAWPGWLLQTGAVSAGAVLMLALYFAGIIGPAGGPEDPYLRGLAQQLVEKGAKFYGAYWCPVCQRQKAAFGASEKRLPYVECSPGGQRASSAPECVAAGVTNYPTWIFPGGDRITSFLEPAELARRVGYVGPPPPGTGIR
jgi:uncharacterized membrane protein